MPSSLSLSLCGDVIEERFVQLKAQSQSRLREFLGSEIQLGFTFVEIAVTQRDLRNAEHSQRARIHAAEAVASLRHFLEYLGNESARGAITQQVDELEQAVAELAITGVHGGCILP